MYSDLLLTPWEAALGTKIKFEAIDDYANIYVPKGTISGEKIKIENKGYKDGKGGRGDLILNVQIVVPKELSENEVKIYEKLKEISSFEPRK